MRDVSYKSVVDKLIYVVIDTWVDIVGVATVVNQYISNLDLHD